MDTLFIEQLKVKARIGVNAWEKYVDQTLLLDITLRYTPVTEDAIEKAIDYVNIANTVKQIVAQNTVALIETLADIIAKHLLQQFAIAHLTLRLSKPGAVPQCQRVGVMIEREPDYYG